jgi:hypothetical protein
VKARFLADADLHPAIVEGLRARCPDVDFQHAKGVIADATEDPDVLLPARRLGRVLVSHDRKTMPGHFYDFMRAGSSPGLILIPQQMVIGAAIAELLLIVECLEVEDFADRILYLPL